MKYSDILHRQGLYMYIFVENGTPFPYISNGNVFIRNPLQIQCGPACLYSFANSTKVFPQKCTTFLWLLQHLYEGW
jgi:hypothetical protein